MTPKQLLMITLIISTTGCASITGSSDQTISVQTFAKTALLQGVVCEIENDKGKWFVTTPGTVQINRSNEDLVVICKKEGHDMGMANVVSGAGASVAGNVGLALLIPIVGIVGAIVDHHSGATYKYPTNVQVFMGQSVTVQDAPPTDDAATNATSRAQVQPAGPPKTERFTITADGVIPEKTQ
jgi:hypothetical protein